MVSSETFLNLISRLEEENLDLFDSLILKPGDLIYIRGHSSSGKSEFLYYIIASLLVPETKEDDDKEEKYMFILFDNDLRFNLKRLLEIILHRLNKYIDSASMITNIDEWIKNILSCIWVLQCFDSTSFKVSLSSLRRRMNCIEENIQREHNNKDFIKIKWFIMVDSIDAYYWTERQELSYHNRNITPKEHIYRSDVLLRKIIKEHISNAYVLCTCSLQYISNHLNEKENTILLNQKVWRFKNHERPYLIEEDGFKFVNGS